MLITGVMTEDIESSYQGSGRDFRRTWRSLSANGEKEIFPTLQLKTEIEPVFSERTVLQHGGKSQTVHP